MSFLANNFDVQLKKKSFTGLWYYPTTVLFNEISVGIKQKKSDN